MQIQNMEIRFLSPIKSPYCQNSATFQSNTTNGSGCCGCKTCCGDGDCGPSGCNQVFKSDSPFVFVSSGSGCRGCSTCDGSGCGPTNCVDDYTAKRWNN